MTPQDRWQPIEPGRKHYMSDEELRRIAPERYATAPRYELTMMPLGISLVFVGERMSLGLHPFGGFPSLEMALEKAEAHFEGPLEWRHDPIGGWAPAPLPDPPPHQIAGGK